MACVLVIEHNQSMERLLTLILSKRGFEVISASSGEEGLQKLHDRGGVDLIITEMYLPDLDAPDLVNLIRQDTNTPVLVMGDNLNDVNVAIAGGADHFLRKPITYGVLIEAVSGLLEEKLRARAS